MFILLIAMTISRSVISEGTGWWGVAAYSIVLSIVMLHAALRQIRILVAMMWSALVWFRLGVAVFVGFGTAVPYFTDQASLTYLNGFYHYSDQEALKFLMMCALSSTVVLLIARFFSVQVPEMSRQDTRAGANVMLRMAIVFLILGGGARYGILLPKWIGLTDGTIAGWLSSLAKLYSAGLFLLTLYMLKSARQFLFIPLALVMIDATVGLLTWDKSEIVFTLAFPFLAFVFNKFSTKRMMIGFLGLFSIIYLTQPIVLYGRSQIALGDFGSIEQRMNVVHSYFGLDSSQKSSGGGGRDPLIRFSYVAPATFFMNRYDSGLAGSAHKNALAALVPRALWPGKPNIGEAGLDVYRILRGDPNPKTSIGITQFAEAYWSFGWIGALIVFLPSGLILAFVSVRSVNMIIAHRWFQLPIILLSLVMGYKVSGSWVPTIMGGFAIYAVVSILFLIVEAIFSRYLRPKAYSTYPRDMRHIRQTINTTVLTGFK
jgi:hypothetical protein